MQVILKEDVYNLGKAGEMVAVRPGYGRNYLLPQGLAVVASKANVRQLSHEQAVVNAQQAKLKAGAEEKARELSKITVKISRKVGEQDKLFGSVTALDVAEGLREANGPTLDRRHIHLPTPIKALGSYEVEVHLHRDVPAKLKVEVVAE